MPTQEPWIRGLVAFHVALYACAYATTSSDAAQATLFVATSGLLYGSRWLNRLAGANWARFSTQNYFDTQGVFAGVLWCAPIIVLQTAMVLGFLWRAAKLLVRVKRLELARRARHARHGAHGEPQHQGQNGSNGAAAEDTQKQAKPVRRRPRAA